MPITLNFCQRNPSKTPEANSHNETRNISGCVLHVFFFMNFPVHSFQPRIFATGRRRIHAHLNQIYGESLMHSCAHLHFYQGALFQYLFLSRSPTGLNFILKTKIKIYVDILCSNAKKRF